MVTFGIRLLSFCLAEDDKILFLKNEEVNVQSVL